LLWRKGEPFSLARELVEHDVVIASGLAKGIDAVAHRAVLAARGP
jgi:DNA processing protein